MAHICWSYWRNPNQQCGDHYVSKAGPMVLQKPAVCAYLDRLEKELKPILDARPPKPF
jgi:hypothetical protein